MLAGPPERILIYHGGTGPTLFLGMLRLTTIFLFGVSCLVVAPAFAAADYPWYLAPAGKPPETLLLESWMRADIATLQWLREAQYPCSSFLTRRPRG